jgi:hypothetical protein
MATQNANAVDIVGGTIDGTAIGSTTPSTVAATTVSATSTITGAGDIATSGRVKATLGTVVQNVGGLAGTTLFPNDGVGQMTWNLNNGGAETDFINCTSGTPSASFNWYQTTPNTVPTSSIMSLSPGGELVTKSGLTMQGGGGGELTFQDGTTQSTAAVSPTLQTNGTNNTVQNKLNLVAGSNVTLTADGSGDVTIATSGGSTYPTVVYTQQGTNGYTGTFSYTTPTAMTGTFRVSVNITANSGSGSATFTGTVSYTDPITVESVEIYRSGQNPGSGNIPTFADFVFYSEAAIFTVTLDIASGSGNYNVNSLIIEQLA